ncbi:MAG: reverse transcriptase domain-containing protein, partial [Methanobacterium sp.]
TWTFTKKPPDQPTVESKWVFKTKTNPDGSKKSKARLVAKGYKQIKFINYEDTFAPVIRKENVRYLLSHAVANDLKVHHMDVEVAFLNGELKEEIYMVLPEGFGENSGKIVKLLKSIYGLKQSSNCWYEKINNTLKENNYYPSNSDPCIYINKNKEGKVKGIIGLYVDDNILIGDEIEIKKMKELLSKYFKMKDLGEAKLLLGMEIERDEKGIRIYQRDYIRKIIDKFGMSECKKVDTPIEEIRGDKNNNSKNNLDSTNINMNDNSELGNQPFKDREKYYQAVGCLNYLACTSRPDICYAVGVVARASNEVKRIIRYLKGTINYYLNYSKDTTNINFRKLIGYSDSSFAPPTEASRKSIGAYLFMYNGGAISWSSYKQSVVAQSSCEAEYVALSEAAKESQWLIKLHQEINQVVDPILIFEDNTSTIKVSENNIFSKRTKHIDIRFHYIRDLVVKKKIILNHCPTDQMPADALTKGLGKSKFCLFRNMMGILEK